MKKSLITILLIIIALASIFSGCSKDTDISYKLVENSGYFTVGYDPQEYHTLEGYGLAINIIKLAAQRMGLEAPIRPVNDWDWEAVLQNEDVDLVLCKTSDINLNTSSLFSDAIVMVKNTSSEITKVGIIDSDACINQKNILGQGTYEYSFYSEKDLLLNDLSMGIVDACIMSEHDALSYIGISNYTVETLSESPIYFVVDANKQTFYDKLNQALEQMKNDGTIDRLKQEYIQSITQ